MLTSTEILHASKNGISETALRKRLSLGWDKERAMTEPIHYRQKQLAKWRSIAEKNGISRHNFEKRIHSLGWTEEKASNKPVRKWKRRDLA